MADEGLTPLRIDSDALLIQVVDLMRAMDTSVYLVGGAVRDRLLELQPGSTPGTQPLYDLDFAVPGDALSVARRIADAAGGAYYALDPRRGVGRALLADDAGAARVVDVARFQGPDLMADLGGRDFTVNAMALDLTRDPPSLIDPHDGQADLRARRLRAVSDQAMQHDPVRGLRAVRLAAQLGFEIETHTRRLIRDAAPFLALMSVERVRDELCKILSLPSPADGLRQLESLDLLAEILPEVTDLKGLAQTGHHRWDAYQHTLQTVAGLEILLPLDGRPLHPDVPFPDQVADHLALTVTGGQDRRLLLTLAALLHDVGKKDTASVDPDGTVRFIQHERVGAALAAEALRRTRFSAETGRLVETIVRHHLRPLSLTWDGVASRRAIHRFFRDTGDAGVEVALLSLADARATTGYGDPVDQSSAAASDYRALLDTVGALLDAYFNRQETVVTPTPLLSGCDLRRQFGLEEGPAIGHLLAALREAQATGQVTTRQQAEQWLMNTIRDQESPNPPIPDPGFPDSQIPGS